MPGRVQDVPTAAVGRTRPVPFLMRVLLVANYQNDGQESMQRFAALMHDSLTAAGHEVRIVRPPSVLGRRGRTLQGVGKWLGYVDKFLVFPPSLRREARWADVVHICDHSNSMYSSWAGHTPSIVTCHDMLAVRGALGEATDCPPSATGKYLQKWIIRW